MAGSIGRSRSKEGGRGKDEILLCFAGGGVGFCAVDELMKVVCWCVKMGCR